MRFREGDIVRIAQDYGSNPVGKQECKIVRVSSSPFPYTIELIKTGEDIGNWSDTYVRLVRRSHETSNW